MRGRTSRGSAVGTTWAFVRRPTVARAAPARDGAAVLRVEATSPLGARELVVVVDRARSAGEEWALVELSADRTGGTTGWVRRDALGELRTTDRVLEVDTGNLHAVLTRRGTPLWAAPIGVGTPDWPTPVGRFYVRARIVPSPSTPLYGAFAFATSCIAPEPWPGARYLAIHGTNRPERIPGRVSKGCVRVRDADVLALRPLLPLGARVVIR